MEKCNKNKAWNFARKYMQRENPNTLTYIITKDSAKQLINDINLYFDNAVAYIEYNPNYNSDVVIIKSTSRNISWFTHEVK